ncbi:hypothetical protein SFRURICE_005736 [Spodoptera frugiperda]|uniref:SFRICE_004437 n=1 Tax=Spodoptera frugiperda TaxID=7108 RepID=A0A2H1VN05_SPOFR|nr:hypothetical protein SFRURICE_005736 [Spodoptera frugiperda]
MRLPSVSRYSLHSEGLAAVLVRSTNTAIKMKYLLVFLVVCVALAAAAPQFFAWPGYAGFAPASRTLVAGPTVVNGAGARFVAPGYVGPAFF